MKLLMEINNNWLDQNYNIEKIKLYKKIKENLVNNFLIQKHSRTTYSYYDNS